MIKLRAEMLGSKQPTLLSPVGPISQIDQNDPWAKHPGVVDDEKEYSKDMNKKLFFYVCRHLVSQG